MRNTTQRIFLCLAALCYFTFLQAQSWSYPTSQIVRLPYEEGAGTAEHPYIIKSAQQLADLAWYVNTGTSYPDVYFTLGADIDLNPGFTFGKDGTITGSGTPQEWVPIGDGTNEGSDLKAFRGHFDGRGHTIKGLYLTVKQKYTGLFGYVEDGSVKNVTVDNSLIKTGALAEAGEIFVGFLVAYASNCQVMGCTNKSSIMIPAAGFVQNLYLGGIVGYLPLTTNADATSCLLKNCHNNGDITVLGDIDTAWIGGVAGSSGATEHANCSNSGAVSGKGTVGGVIGSTGYRDIFTDLHNSGPVTSYHPFGGAGGVLGRVGADTLKNCSNTAPVTGINAAAGIAVTCEIHCVESCTNTGEIRATAEVSTDETTGSYYPWAAGLFAQTDYVESFSGCVNKGNVYSNGDAAGIAVKLADHSQEESENSFLKESHNEADVVSLGNGRVAGIVVDMSCNWLQNCYNTGKIETGGDCAGGIAAEVQCRWDDTENHIDGCYNTGAVTGAKNVGGIYGKSDQYTTLSNSHNQGEISGITWVGGLIGDGGAMTACYNTGKVTGTDKNVGGLAGAATGVSLSYNTAAVTGAVQVGGLCGAFNGQLRNAYNLGEVTATDWAGGLLGTTTSPDVKYAYSVGKLTAPEASYAGAIAGGLSEWASEYLFSNCYYLSTSTIPALGGSNIWWDTDKTLIEAKTEAEFANGTVCILLNDNQSPTPWGQVPGTDATPLLNGGGNPEVDPNITGLVRPEASAEPFLTCDGTILRICIPFERAALYTLTGQKVTDLTTSSLSLSSLPRGVYLLTVCSEGTQRTQKFVVK
ncbi:MAG: T9SS type A sorting domain-containing protein [Bacteroides sp.]|nr:T9SS type A sorting domain-containing protein [Bacteroides sp.]